MELRAMSNLASDYLNDLCVEIVNHLADAARPMGSAHLADALKVKHDAVQAAVCKLIIRDRIVMVGRCENQRPIYVLRLPATEPGHGAG
jgi:hypothetical protein